MTLLADFFAWLGGWVLWLAASVSDWIFGKDRDYHGGPPEERNW